MIDTELVALIAGRALGLVLALLAIFECFLAGDALLIHQREFRFTLSAPELHAAVGAPIRAFLALEPIVFQIVSIFANGTLFIVARELSV